MISRFILTAILFITISQESAGSSLRVSVSSNFSGTPECGEDGTSFASASCAGADPSWAASGFGSADYGTLKVFDDATNSGFRLSMIVFSQAQDDFTVLNASAGDTFEMDFTLDGQIVAPGGIPGTNIANLGINAGLFHGTGCLTTLTTSYSAVTPYICQMQTPLSAGTNSFFSIIELTATIDIRATTARVDFSDTLQVDRVAVLLPNGMVDPNAIIQTSSGFVYPDGAAAAPEPNTELTAMIGSLVLLVLRVGPGRSRSTARTSPTIRADSGQPLHPLYERHVRQG